MTLLGKKWAGRLYGTNTGNLFLEINQEGNKVSGLARIMDNLYGLTLYKFSGEFNDELVLNCIPIEEKEGMEYGDVKVKAILTPEGRLRGEWESTIGTAGTLDAYPHDIVQPAQDSGISESVPEQIFNKNIELGSVRLFREDLIKIISFIQKDFLQARVIATCNLRGSQVTKYASDLLSDVDGIDELSYLKLTIQEPEAHGINKVIVIEFSEFGTSEVRVSGINESWVIGKAQSISLQIKPNQNNLITSYRKHGLNFNGAIFLLMLITIPEFVNWVDRSIFVFTVLLLLIILLTIHNKFIPNSVVYLTQKTPGIFKRIWPSALSWFTAFSSSLIAAYVFHLLTK